MRARPEAWGALITALAVLAMLPVAQADVILADLQMGKPRSLSGGEALVFPVKKFVLNVSVDESFEGWLIVPIPTLVSDVFQCVWIPGKSVAIMRYKDFVDLWIYGNWTKGNQVIEGWSGPGSCETLRYRIAALFSGGIERRDLVVLPLLVIVDPEIVLNEKLTGNKLFNLFDGARYAVYFVQPNIEVGNWNGSAGWYLYFNTTTSDFKVYTGGSEKRIASLWKALQLGHAPLLFKANDECFVHDFDEGSWVDIKCPRATTSPLVVEGRGGVLTAVWGAIDKWHWLNTTFLLTPYGILSPGFDFTLSFKGRLAYIWELDENLLLVASGPVVPGFLKEEYSGYAAVLAPDGLVWFVDSMGWRTGSLVENSVGLVPVPLPSEHIIWESLPDINATIRVASLNGVTVRDAYEVWALLAAAGSAAAALWILRRR